MAAAAWHTPSPSNTVKNHRSEQVISLTEVSALVHMHDYTICMLSVSAQSMCPTVIVEGLLVKIFQTAQQECYKVDIFPNAVW